MHICIYVYINLYRSLYAVMCVHTGAYIRLFVGVDEGWGRLLWLIDKEFRVKHGPRFFINQSINSVVIFLIFLM